MKTKNLIYLAIAGAGIYFLITKMKKNKSENLEDSEIKAPTKRNETFERTTR